MANVPFGRLAAASLLAASLLGFSLPAGLASGTEAPGAPTAHPAAAMHPSVEAAPPAEAAPVAPVAAGAAAANAALAGGKPLSEAQQYCSNIAAAAADARFAWQRKQITDLEGQLKQRIAELQDRQADLKAMMDKRDEAMKRAGDTVVAIYAKMKPDAAAAQIALLDDDMASSILTQLAPKQSSIILDQIPADRAAKLVGAMAANSTLGKKS